jgi:hypothetical protein
VRVRERLDMTKRVILGATAVVVALCAFAAPVGAATVRHGLAATYYQDAGFRQVKLKRIDPRINFMWRSDHPAA